MMTIESFNEAGSTYTRRLLTGTGLSIVSMIAAIALSFWVVSSHRAKILALFGQLVSEPVAEGLLPALMLPGMILLITGIWLSERRANVDRRHYCPHCTQNLVNNRFLVVATRNYPHCGKRVLEEPNVDGWKRSDLQVGSRSGKRSAIT